MRGLQSPHAEMANAARGNCNPRVRRFFPFCDGYLFRILCHIYALILHKDEKKDKKDTKCLPVLIKSRIFVGDLYKKTNQQF